MQLSGRCCLRTPYRECTTCSFVHPPERATGALAAPECDKPWAPGNEGAAEAAVGSDRNWWMGTCYFLSPVTVSCLRSPCTVTPNTHTYGRRAGYPVAVVGEELSRGAPSDPLCSGGRAAAPGERAPCRPALFGPRAPDTARPLSADHLLPPKSPFLVRFVAGQPPTVRTLVGSLTQCR